MPASPGVVTVNVPVLSEKNWSVTTVPGGICEACTTTFTAAAELITVSGTAKLPVGDAGTATPLIELMRRLPGGTVGKYRLGVDVIV